MVTVALLVEGGSTDIHADAATMDNSSRLREGFHKLFSSGIETDSVSMVVKPMGSYPGVVKSGKKETDALMLLDLDGPPEAKSARLNTLKLEAEQDRVFFMVQTMEAWFLSQPDNIERCFASKKMTTETLANDSRLKDIPPQRINKPDKVLHELLMSHFVTKKAGKEDPLKYGKLKNALDLLLFIDIHRLVRDFEDVDALMKAIKSKTA